MTLFLHFPWLCSCHHRFSCIYISNFLVRISLPTLFSFLWTPWSVLWVVSNCSFLFCPLISPSPPPRQHLSAPSITINSCSLQNSCQQKTNKSAFNTQLTPSLSNKGACCTNSQSTSICSSALLRPQSPNHPSCIIIVCMCAACILHYEKWSKMHIDANVLHTHAACCYTLYSVHAYCECAAKQNAMFWCEFNSL